MLQFLTIPVDLASPDGALDARRANDILDSLARDGRLTELVRELEPDRIAVVEDPDGHAAQYSSSHRCLALNVAFGPADIRLALERCLIEKEAEEKLGAELSLTFPCETDETDFKTEAERLAETVRFSQLLERQPDALAPLAAAHPRSLTLLLDRKEVLPAVVELCHALRADRAAVEALKVMGPLRDFTVGHFPAAEGAAELSGADFLLLNLLRPYEELRSALLAMTEGAVEAPALPESSDCMWHKVKFRVAASPDVLDRFRGDVEASFREQAPAFTFRKQEGALEAQASLPGVAVAPVLVLERMRSVATTAQAKVEVTLEGSASLQATLSSEADWVDFTSRIRALVAA